MGDVQIVYQVRGVGRVFVSDNGAELANGTEVATRDRHGRWKVSRELGSVEAQRVFAQLQEHDRNQGSSSRDSFTGELQDRLDGLFGLRGGK